MADEENESSLFACVGDAAEMKTAVKASELSVEVCHVFLALCVCVCV